MKRLLITCQVTPCRNRYTKCGYCHRKRRRHRSDESEVKRVVSGVHRAMTDRRMLAVHHGTHTGGIIAIDPASEKRQGRSYQADDHQNDLCAPHRKTVPHYSPLPIPICEALTAVTKAPFCLY